MATAKKTAAKKTVSKVKKAAAAKSAPLVAEKPAVSADAATGAGEGKRKPGRPPGSGNKGKKAGKKGAPGRKPSTKFLYSISHVPVQDDLGLPSASSPSKVQVIGPFDSEEAAIQDALGTIGTRTDLEVTLYRDYRTGRPEVKTKLI